MAIKRVFSIEKWKRDAIKCGFYVVDSWVLTQNETDALDFEDDNVCVSPQGYYIHINWTKKWKSPNRNAVKTWWDSLSQYEQNSCIEMAIIVALVLAVMALGCW